LLLLIKKLKNKKIQYNKRPSPFTPVVVLLLFSSLLSLLSFTGCLFSPEFMCSAEGYIYKETVLGDSPIEGVLVSISSSVNTTLTDSEGYFRIDEISIGNQTLTIAKADYITGSLSDIVIKKDEITLINCGDPIIIHTSDGGQSLLDTGYNYYNQQEYNIAINNFQQLIDEYPDSEYADDAQYYIAWSNYYLTLYEQAIIEFEKVTENYPYSEYVDDSQYYINYCAEKKLGNYVKSLLGYYDFLKIYPDSEYADDAQLGVGDSWYAMGEYSYAITEGYQKLLDDYPQSSLLSLAQYSIAQSYRKQTNYEQAIIEFGVVIQNYPESDYPALAQYYIGYSHYQNQDYNNAIVEFQKILEDYADCIWLDGNNRLIAPCAKYYAGWCYEKIEQWSNALSAYQEIIDNYPYSTWSDGSLIIEYAQYRIDWINENHPPS